MDMHDALAQLRQVVMQIAPLSQEDWDAFAAIWSPFEAKRKTLLTTTGDTERYLYFVIEGIQRIYYVKPDGKEATLLFTYAPSFGGVLDSFLMQRPSAYHLETLTQSVFLRAHYNQWQALLQQHRAIEQLAQVAVVNAMSGLLRRMAELQCFTAEERFKALLSRSPHVLRLIPHKYLANYLALDATTFSKLLGTVRL
ncbi:MAG TPA: Crp/Fnr family transcriptional regulator [Phnomibacter sp.]|nr:Crp/Fnr family transcriptional regulator [Phnomibacter sp.]